MNFKKQPITRIPCFQEKQGVCGLVDLRLRLGACAMYRQKTIHCMGFFYLPFRQL